MHKLPSFQFYPGDWLKDPAVRSVSLSARGLWIDMLCLMHESDRRGYLQHATGKPVTAEQLARMTGCSTDEVSRLLQELCDSGVFSCTDNEVIYSRRIVRDERKRQLCSEAGAKGGGNPTFKGDSKGTPKGRFKGEAKQKPKASSSSSSSSSKQIPPLAPSGAGGQSSVADELFEIFYRAYPRHENPEKARIAFRKAGITAEMLPDLLAWIKQAKCSEQWQKKDKIPYLSTWLNQKRWRGDPPPLPEPDQRTADLTVGAPVEQGEVEQHLDECEYCAGTGRIIAIYERGNGAASHNRVLAAAPWQEGRDVGMAASFRGEARLFRCRCPAGNAFDNLPVWEQEDLT